MTLKSHFLQTPDLRLHYLDTEEAKKPLVLMHGLTANAHAFDGLLQAGLHKHYRIISIDLRGRGLSDKPEQAYSLAAHVQDVLHLLDHLGLEQVILGGHSFGALLSLHMAAHFPKRISRLLLLDAAMRMHPDTKTLLQPAMSRLDRQFPSWEQYLAQIKAAPYLDGFWDEAMLSYYQADVEHLPDGTVRPYPRLADMAEAVNNVLSEPWGAYIGQIPHPALLVNAVGPYGLAGSPALLPEELARETVALMQNCRYAQVWGNHQTMLYGQGAAEIVAAIEAFLAEEAVF